MAYQALYRKYRPLCFSDVVGQEHITKTLKNQLASNKTVHAYLFTGTRGTGKTSCAKILARAVNCLDIKDGDPCLCCESCKNISNGENTDIVEIDAASNNGVEDIRELRDLISFAPSSSKYRVYIIDEVHMLTMAAFNALLKTLEEPPAHVIFILATTEVHKLPATILSRCQRFDFRRIDNEKICERIQYIAEKEGLTVTDEAATLIASAADGGMRDALSILDLCASTGKEIDEKTVESVCAMAGNDYLIEMADAVKNGDSEKAMLLVDRLHNSSVDMLRLLSELTTHYRDLMIVKTVKSASRPIVCSAARMKTLEEQAEKYSIKEILYCLNTLQSAFAPMQSSNRRCEMEMTLLRMCDPALSGDLSALEKRVSALENGSFTAPKAEKAPPKNETGAVVGVDEEIPLPEDENPPAAEPQNEVTATANNTDDLSDDIKILEEWPQILKVLGGESPLMAGVLKGSKAYIKGEYLLIDAPNSQFRSLIKGGNPAFKESIRKSAFKVLGHTYKLGPYKKAETNASDDPLAALANKLKELEIN